MLKRHPASNAYARALLEVGAANGQADRIGEDLVVFAQLLRDVPQLKVFFESPKIPRREKKAVLDRALKGRCSDSVRNLLMLIIDRGRQELFAEIATIYGEHLDEVRQRVHVRITSATPLAADSKARLVKQLATKLGREILAEERVDAELLGGLKLRVGDTVIDGTVRSQLEKVRERIASQRLGRDLVHEN
ncbi:MAG: ATP synthase F1 subunit delta [Planctomycetota bacterium]